MYSHSDSAATLNITGSGSLTANGSSSGIMVQSNGDNATLTIRNVDVTGQSAYGGGVTVRAGQIGASECTITLNVEGGSLTASGNTGIIFDSADPYTVSATNLTVSNNAIVRANDVISYISDVNLQIGAGNASPGGIVFDGDEGTVYGSVTLQENLTISEGESLDIPGGSSLTIPSGTTLTNEGTVTNSGTLTNNGTINNSGTLPGNIQGTAPPGITTTSIDDGTVGTAYSKTLEASGSPTSWDVTDGSLPAGLTLNKNTGVISGTPTAQGTSSFTVTARNSGGSDSEPLSLTVNAPAIVSVTGVELDQDSMELIEGGSAALTATVEPDNATNKTVTWSSDNESVATVNNGVVTAHSAGNANITVTTTDQNKTATCAVTVLAKTYDISATPAALDFGSVAAGYTAAPAEQTVTITNRGNQNVTLNQPTAEHYEIGTLTATTLTPGAVATFTVQPRADLGIGTYRETIAISGSDGVGTSLAAGFTVSAIPVTGVSLDTGTLSLTEGDTGALTATVEPDNATNKTVTWSSDNESVATVNNGVVTAHSAGNATITVTTGDGNRTAACVVTVTHGSLTHTPGNAATCTADGNTEYWTCETCGTHFSDAGGNTQTTPAQTVIPASGHSYGEPVWNWSEDGKSCTVTFICANDDSHKETPEVAVSSIVKTPATCTEKGVTEHTATAEFNGRLFTAAKEVADIDQTAHNYIDGKCTVCGAALPNYQNPAKPAESNTASRQEDNAGAVQTGDVTNPAAWIILLTVSVFVSAGAVVFRKKKEY